ncbi:integrase [Gossypium australe]|uniref:Integrase n=1 Tax=Gossypium australe TaxID=47621 RepID=A0A5B6X3S7_9ROSI|nr:integrase [Gossypium australe]
MAHCIIKLKVAHSPFIQVERRCIMYWWPGMKLEICDFVAKCLICQQVKAEHQVSSGLLWPIMIPE